ncbi:MAG: di-heme oxidoredictase family protein [Methylotetracoccus sp.]
MHRLLAALVTLSLLMPQAVGATEGGDSTNASPGAAAPQKATGQLLVDEWYSDLPWHQKLSTKDSNLIDTPFVMPFAALPARIRKLAECNDSTDPAADTVRKSRCMLRYGIVNVMAMHRTDRLYKPGEAPTGQDCSNDDCVEVATVIQRFNTLGPNGRKQPDTIMNDSWPSPNNRKIPSLGFALTESTIFAPWRPWYSGHYCAVKDDNISDSVCYEDYFTTQLQAGTDKANGQVWLNDRPALFVPQGTEPGFTQFCGSGRTDCTMYLGKVEWIKGATAPTISTCGIGGPAKCKAEVDAKTKLLDEQFNVSLSKFKDIGRFPWKESPVVLGDLIETNPFLGYYKLKWFSKGGSGGSSLFMGDRYVLPKRCVKGHLANARHGGQNAIAQLRDCTLNYEIHTSGYHEQWNALYGGKLTDQAIGEIDKVLKGTAANQYGRTMFMYSGIHEQQIPVPFKLLDDGESVRDKMYSASIYTQYLPMVNPADLTLFSKSYTNEFWHAFFMSDHMNQTPDHFIRGIRGRTLWHNEYRANIMYLAEETRKNDMKGTAFEDVLTHVDFPAGFQVKSARTPFHGNTCDSCHIRNGSGIPLMPNGQIPNVQQANGMNAGFIIHRDYTYSNKELPSMKMVLFDLKDDSDRNEICDDNNHSIPSAPAAGGYYQNKIMNFYGNSFHVNQQGRQPGYDMSYVDIKPGDGFEVVDTTPRSSIVGKVYSPMRVKLGAIDATGACAKLRPKPAGVAPRNWPTSCNEVSGTAVSGAIDSGEIGFMQLMGRRLGNTPLIEMMPTARVLEAQKQQATVTKSADFAGCFSLAPGTRNNARANYRTCQSGQLGDRRQDCYLGRFGWIGDRASLEDQIANAASVEMNVSSVEGYDLIHPTPVDDAALVRYKDVVCGAADAGCRRADSNSDITEEEIGDMAAYQRWIGIPNRSEYQVSSDPVQRGEKVFKNLQCDSCHIIERVVFDKGDNMLPDEDREHLEKLKQLYQQKPDYPFFSYLGTDLLMHDMGYLSQVAKAPAGVKLRDIEGRLTDPKYKAYIQHIRTPALKGMRLNQFVTDSNHNTINPIKKDAATITPGCDFLLHDGRACDAIEAAFLHDGPAVKSLDLITRLSSLSARQLTDLRAFLYSL